MKSGQPVLWPCRRWQNTHYRQPQHPRQGFRYAGGFSAGQSEMEHPNFKELDHFVSKRKREPCRSTGEDQGTFALRPPRALLLEPKSSSTRNCPCWLLQQCHISPRKAQGKYREQFQLLPLALGPEVMVAAGPACAPSHPNGSPVDPQWLPTARHAPPSIPSCLLK